MSSHPAHDPGIFIVDLAIEDTPAPGTVLCTGIWPPHGPKPAEANKTHYLQLQRLKDLLNAELIKPHTGDSLDELAQEDESHIAISHGRRWRGDERLTMDRIIDRAPAGGLRESGVEGTIIRLPSRESAAMTEELPHGGGDLSSSAIGWDISMNGGIEPHLARVKQSHHRRRRGNRLG